MPVSMTAKEMTVRSAELYRVPSMPALAGRRERQRTPPAAVNFSALESRLREDLRQRCSSVTIAAGSTCSTDRATSSLLFGHRTEGALHVVADVGEPIAPAATSILPASTLDRSRMS